MKNVDAEISKIVYESVSNIGEKEKKKLENVTNKSIAVLQEAGIFSMLLMIRYSAKKQGEDVSKFLLSLIRKITESNTDILNLEKINDQDDYKSMMKYLETISKDITKTLFLANAIYQAFVYLRYHLKAL